MGPLEWGSGKTASLGTSVPGGLEHPSLWARIIAFANICYSSQQPIQTYIQTYIYIYIIHYLQRDTLLLSHFSGPFIAA